MTTSAALLPTSTVGTPGPQTFLDQGLNQTLIYVGASAGALLLICIASCLLYDRSIRIKIRNLEQQKLPAKIQQQSSQSNLIATQSQSERFVVKDNQTPVQSQRLNISAAAVNVTNTQGSVGKRSKLKKNNTRATSTLTDTQSKDENTSTDQSIAAGPQKFVQQQEVATSNKQDALVNQLQKTGSQSSLRQQINQSQVTNSSQSSLRHPLTTEANGSVRNSQRYPLLPAKSVTLKKSQITNISQTGTTVTLSRRPLPDLPVGAHQVGQDTPMLEMPKHPMNVDLSGLPQTPSDIKQAKGQALRIMLDIQGFKSQPQNNQTGVSDGSNEITMISPTGNIISNYVTFMDSDNTYVNQQQPFSVPAYRQIIQDVDYRLGVQVAQGGTSIIYMADILDTGLRDSNPSQWGAVAKVLQDTELMQQEDIFNQEIAIMSDLSDHPNFVRLLGYSENPKTILMPYYRFGTLKDLIFKKNKDFKIPDDQWNLFLVRALLLDIATALAYMHSKNIVHSDLKPDNVLLDVLPSKSLICLLTDFSISSITSDDRMGVKALKKSHLVGLSVAYAAPEIVQAFFEFRKAQKKDPTVEMVPVHGPTHARDSYSYAILSYEVTTRSKAYEGLTRDDIRQAVLRGQRPLYSDAIIDKRVSDRNWGILCNITETCWSSDANFRLTMDAIVKRLLLIKT